MHVVVTGASSGIGEALVREYAAAGAKVTMVARRKALLDALATDLGDTVRVQVADLGDPAQATAWIDDAIAAFGPIDVMVNNAGVQIVAQTTDISVEKMRNLLEVDLYAPLAIIAVLLPKMLARGSGAFVNISSVAALAPTPGMVYYNAAKAGLGAASESLRGELMGTPITVVTVYPGPVDTPMARAAYEVVPPTAAVKMLPEGNPAALARKIRRAVERRAARIIYPWAYTVARHTPAMTRIFMDAFTPLPASQLPAAKTDGS
jgi:short-subunit dehydrogenase